MSIFKLNFSKSALNNLPPPEKGKRVYYYDLKTRGLAICVTGTGHKTFVVYRKIHGKPERITLGVYPDLDLETARLKAYEINAAIARGENPNESKRLAKAEWTLGEWFENYLEIHAKPHKRTWKADESQFKRYLQSWQHRKLSAIRKIDVQALHSRLGQEHGKYAANRLLSLLQTVFNKAIEFGWEKPNPVLGVKKFSEKSRERFLQAGELPKFFHALAADQNADARDYILLSLLTGARKSNLLAMRWEELNLSQAVWTIPLTKNGSSQMIPLVPEAQAILNRRLRAKHVSPFIFPSRSKCGHLVEPKKAWQRILKRAGIQNLRLHDLRRSLGSWQAATGANLAVIGKTLNHKDMKSTAIYARLDLEPVRQAMEIATQAIWEAGEIGSNE